MRIGKTLFWAGMLLSFSSLALAQESSDITPEQRIYNAVSDIGGRCEFTESWSDSKLWEYDITFLIDSTKQEVLDIDAHIYLKGWIIKHSIKAHQKDWEYWVQGSNIEEVKKTHIESSDVYWDNWVLNIVNYILNMSDEELTTVCAVFS